jgi:hypothetical protein
VLRLAKWLYLAAGAVAIGNVVGSWAGAMPRWAVYVPAVLVVVALVVAMAGAVALARRGRSS